jgi:hypothetical protein
LAFTAFFKIAIFTFGAFGVFMNLLKLYDLDGLLLEILGLFIDGLFDLRLENLTSLAFVFGKPEVFSFVGVLNEGILLY